MDPPAAGRDAHTWTALSALCIAGEDHRVVFGGGGGDGGDADGDAEQAEAVVKYTYCDNHDDGKTVATWECGECTPLEGGNKKMSLCAGCDGVIHLKKCRRDHKRNVIKVERPPETLRVDCSDGTARARLQWLMVRL